MERLVEIMRVPQRFITTQKGYPGIVAYNPLRLPWQECKGWMSQDILPATHCCLQGASIMTYLVALPVLNSCTGTGLQVRWKLLQYCIVNILFKFLKRDLHLFCKSLLDTDFPAAPQQVPMFFKALQCGYLSLLPFVWD